MSTKRVAFVHPDLGIGGAERLVVDAAIALQAHGHSVSMFTSHHDPAHCFAETRDGSLKVNVLGNWLPRTILGGLYLLCAIVRNIYLSIVLVLFYPKFDVLFVDQLSVSVPILRLSGSKVLFYCHFPDKLLAKQGGWIKSLYRLPLDWVEEATTGASDLILVNSKFTGSVFKKAFPSIQVQPQVLYPSINFTAYDRKLPLPPNDSLSAHFNAKDITVILSINRFERKKNIGLAIQAFAKLTPLATTKKKSQQLIIAGGYDHRVPENVEHLKELQDLAQSLDLSIETLMPGSAATEASITANVLFVPSFSEVQRSFLLSKASVLVYTPANEHFGIVPVEAMYSRIPVVAVNSGGPTESILHESTGLLVPADPESFATAIGRILNGDLNAKTMGSKGHERVVQLYSLDKFGKELDRIIVNL